jgi:hypothetical protein
LLQKLFSAQARRKMPTNQEQLAILAELTFDVLRPYFYCPLSKVAVEFGVCATVFKKRCRDLGVKRWPFRKIRSLRRSIAKPNCTAAERRIMEEQIESIHDEASHVAAVGDHSKAAVLLVDGAAAPAWRRASPIAMAPAALWTSYIEPTVPLKKKRKAPCSSAPAAKATAAAAPSASSPAATINPAGTARHCATALEAASDAILSEEDEQQQRRPRKRVHRPPAAAAATVPSFGNLSEELMCAALDTPVFATAHAADAAEVAAEVVAAVMHSYDSDGTLSDHDAAEVLSSSESDAELELGDFFGFAIASAAAGMLRLEPAPLIETTSIEPLVAMM